MALCCGIEPALTAGVPSLTPQSEMRRIAVMDAIESTQALSTAAQHEKFPLLFSSARSKESAYGLTHTATPVEGAIRIPPVIALLGMAILQRTIIGLDLF